MKTVLFLMIVLYIAKLLLESFALSLVTSLVRAWTWLCTLCVQRCDREELQAQTDSELHENIASDRRDGYSPVQIAMREFLRWLSGVVGDIVWATPLVLESLPEKLERGGETIRRFRTPETFVAFLGTFLMFNTLALFAEEREGNNLMMMNFCLVGAAVLVWKQDQRWTRVVLYSLFGAATVGLIGFFIAFVVTHKAYNHPLFSQLILEGGIFLLPVVASAFWASDFCRSTIFGGKWWAVLLCTGISFAVSAALLFAFAREPWMLMLVWGLYGVAFLFLFAICGMFALGATAICSGLLKTTAFTMCTLSTAMRRLQ